MANLFRLILVFLFTFYSQFSVSATHLECIGDYSGAPVRVGDDGTAALNDSLKNRTPAWAKGNCNASNGRTGCAQTYTVSHNSCSSVVSSSYVGCAAGDVKNTWFESDGSSNWGPGGNIYANCRLVNDNCPSGQKLNSATNKCEKDCSSKRGQDVDIWVPAGGSLPNAGCQDSCAVIKAGNTWNCTVNATGAKCQFASYQYDGSSCSGGDTGSTGANKTVTANSTPTTSEECTDKGMGSITIGGVVTCVPNSPNTPASSTATTTTTTTTASGTSSTSSTSTTTTSDGTKITQTTVGSDGTTTTTETTKDKFCEQNPNSNLCKGSNNSIIDTCGAFSCKSDDPVECSGAEAVWLSACVLELKQSSVDDGQALASNVLNTDLARQLNISGTIDPGSSLDSSSFLAGGCVQDKTISMPFGGAVVLPFSQMCGTLGIIGNIFVACTFLWAAVYIFKGGAK